MIPADPVVEPEHGGVQGLVLARAHVEDRVLDQLLGRHLQIPTLYINRVEKNILIVKRVVPTGLWLMYHVRFAGGSVASELQFSCRLSPTEYLNTALVSYLQTKVIRRFPKFSQSRRRSLLRPSPG